MKTATTWILGLLVIGILGIAGLVIWNKQFERNRHIAMSECAMKMLKDGIERNTRQASDYGRFCMGTFGYSINFKMLAMCADYETMAVSEYCYE